MPNCERATVGNSGDVAMPAPAMTFPPVVVITGTDGLAELAAVLAPAAVWVFTVWTTRRRRRRKA
ncbi:hypothetical protein GCM10023347_07320 [Streptomyces chumphonensis]|uniref:hypothetical protein n=1 Tax=Streptomyces chumphonensis TaxID=1214925 RepID=UPI0031E85A09